MLVFIQNIPRPSPLGLDAWVTANGQKIKKNKVGPRASVFIRALYSPKIGGLATGLHKPWLENGEPQLDENGKQLLLQDKMERKWNLPKGFLHNRPIDLATYLDKPVQDLSYFQRMSWRLSDGTTTFDLSKMDDELGYYVILESDKVANSLQEYNQRKWPKAEFYVVLTTEENELKYERLFSKSKAFAALHSKEFTDDIKRKMVSLLELASSKADLSSQHVHNLLVEHIEAAANNNNLDKFFHLASLLNTAESRAQFEAMYLLKQALDTRVVYEKQGTYTWVKPSGGTLVIGDRYSEAVDFFLNPKKGAEVKDIQEQISKRLKA